MSDRPVWFDASIVGAVFASIVMPTAPSFGMLLVNVVALACFVAPIVAWAKGDRGAER